MDKPESFETQEYTPKAENLAREFSVIKQIFEDHARDTPTAAVMVKLSSGALQLIYNSYEPHLPSRLKEIEGQANDALNDALKYLKKEFKKRTKKVLDLVEKKDLRNSRVEKVSLNERYMVLYWRVYSL